MIADDQNKALKIVAESAVDNPQWIDFVDYCIKREKGLRKDAFKTLDKFLKSTTDWTLDEKIGFTKFLLDQADKVKEADYGPFPQPLSEKLIKPTLEKWCELENSESSPFFWYGKYYDSKDHLIKAIDINPNDDRARVALINRLSNFIYQSIHHLPDGYIGNPEDDIRDGEEAMRLISMLKDKRARDYWEKELNEDLEIVNNYIDWKKSGHQDFDKWGQENFKRVGLGLTRVYYYKK